MEENISNLIKAENIKVETKNKYDEYDNRFFIVTLTIIDSEITATSYSSAGLVSAYNQCLKELEFKFLLDELDTHQIALKFVKSKNENLKLMLGVILQSHLKGYSDITDSIAFRIKELIN